MRPRAASERITPLTRWTLALTAPGACETPAQAAALTDWLAAAAPGTTAAALHAVGRPYEDLFGYDVWWRTTLEDAGSRTLRFDGLATLCEVWLDDNLLLASESMFLADAVDVELKGGEILWLAFRALSPRLAAKLPRARWKTRITSRAALRGVRTTLMGQMPGWQPPVDCVGPWREVALVERGPVRVDAVTLYSEWTGAGGRLSIQVRPPLRRGGSLNCAGVSGKLVQDASGVLQATLDLPDVRPWWPATHGDQPLYPVTLTLDRETITLGRVALTVR